MFVAGMAVWSAMVTAGVGMAWWLPWWLVTLLTLCTVTVSMAHARPGATVAAGRRRVGVVAPDGPDEREARSWAAEVVRDPQWWEAQGCLATAAVVRDLAAPRLPVHTTPVRPPPPPPPAPRVSRACAGPDCLPIHDPDTGEHLGYVYNRAGVDGGVSTICTGGSYPTRETRTAAGVLPCPGCGCPVVRVDTVPPWARPPLDHAVIGPLTFTCPGPAGPNPAGMIYTVEVQWHT